MIRYYSTQQLLTVNGEALTKARIAAKLPVEKAAAAIGVNPGYISKWEQGKLIPSLERILKLVDLYKTHRFVRLNPRVVLTELEAAALGERFSGRKLFTKTVTTTFKLNGEMILTPEEIEVVKGLREG